MLTIVIGGQFGGEGKGKICAYLAKQESFPIVSRCGGVNSSHTVVEGGRKVRLRLMPTAAVVSKPRQIVFGAGTLLHLPTLFDEIRQLNIPQDRITIDPQAGIITDECVEEQRKDKRYSIIGSTLTGTGLASARRCSRLLPLAREFPELHGMLGDVPMILFEILHTNMRQKSLSRTNILVEGHQGTGLSNYHGDYPYTSSRDCVSAAMLSELGLAPTWPMRVVLALKVFPTRNHAGELPGELSQIEADAFGIIEHGGGSWGIQDQRRRVGTLDLGTIVRAARLNGATELALTGADYLDPTIRGATKISQLSKEVRDFVGRIEKTTKLCVRYISTGPETDAMVDISKGEVSDIKQGTKEPFLPNIILGN